jgi:unsaturated chondroitin disaccharide hydrolase
MNFADAFDFVQHQVRRTIEKYPDLHPMYTTNGLWDTTGDRWTHWCEGFFPGMMWLIHQKTGDRWMRQQAETYSKRLEPRQHDRAVHDLGFIFMSTYLPWYRLSGDPALNAVLIQTGRTLAMRFQSRGRYLCSFLGPESLFIDIMANVGIIFHAARETGDAALLDVARQHCLTTRRCLVRGDGSTAHEGIFDTATGEFLGQSTRQGYRGDSCWSRGLAWALYGFHTAYEYSGDERFLATARACADFYLRNAPPGGVPWWDFDVPQGPDRIYDSSAAAIAAAGLIRQGRKHEARAILETLCDGFLVAPHQDGVLSQGVYHIHKKLGVSESVIWGDYFFTEALAAALSDE